MRKSLLMGIKEDVAKHSATKSVCTGNGDRTPNPFRSKPVMTMEQLQEFINASLEQSKKRIVTFNHPEAFK